MSYYTVRRDDSEIRVVICPKCPTHEKGVADVTKFNDVIPYKNDSYLLKLMQCNACKTYFTFYREDGLGEITKEQAMEALEKGRCDMREGGKDCHGHSFYIVFKSKPPTISDDKYSELLGYLKDKDGNYNDEDPLFKKAIDVIPTVNQLIRYRNFIRNIDFDSMKYLVGENRINDYFTDVDIVDKIKLEEPHPMFCFSHGGSEACEATNKQYGFTCPRCNAAQENACYETPSPNQEGK